MKIGFVSLGCPKNLLDTEVMLATLNSAGYEITAEETEADVIILNTCGFIEEAKSEAIDNILDLAWLKTNAKLKKLIVCGCLVQRYGEEILKQFPEVDAVLSVGAIHDIVSVIERVNAGERFALMKAPEEAALGGDSEEIRQNCQKNVEDESENYHNSRGLQGLFGIFSA
jgi:ribosomal protein S12 methylthiotransferase